MEERTVKINLERKIDQSYEITIGSSLFPRIAEHLKNISKISKYAVITDDNVARIHSPSFLRELTAAEVPHDLFVVPSGEGSKCRLRKDLLFDELAKQKYGRDGAIIAFGGGMVGDLAGYVAGIYKRGIPFFQVPTTLLAQADASVGGKTGIDTPHGKNLEGVFNQPKQVFIDVSTLVTLPEHELRSGLAETIKHGIIYNKHFLSYLENSLPLIISTNQEVLVRIAEGNCKIKGDIVQQDPEERGIRAILNYGHTIGHAIEHLSKLSIPHGYCVSIGMMVEGRISNLLGFLSKAELEFQEKILNRAGLPVQVPARFTDQDIIAATSQDKKAIAGKVRYSLPVRLGEMHDFGGKYTTPVDPGIVYTALMLSR